MSWYTVGKIKQAHSLKGELYLIIFSGEWSWSKQVSEFKLIEPADPKGTRGKIFKIVKLKPHKKGLIVRLQGCDNRNEAEALEGRLVQIPEDLLVSKPGEEIFLKEVLGFKVKAFNQCVGEVVGFSSNGPQDLLIIKNEQTKFQVPFIEEFIERICFEEKTIEMDFPEGLMELEV